MAAQPRGLSCTRWREPTPWTSLQRAGAVAAKVCAVLVAVLFVALLTAYGASL